MTRTDTLAIVVCLASALGCVDQRVGDVHGTVTLEGEPLAGAMVMFEPQELGRPSLAVTDSDGSYRLTFSATQKGAAIGKHLVRISTGRDAVYDDTGKVTIAGVQERIPSEYNSQSTQQVTVKPGTNQIDFHISVQKP